MRRVLGQKAAKFRAGRLFAVFGALGGTALLVSFPACSDDGAECPENTEPLSDQQVDIYRQLEVCASRVTGTTLRREVLPRLEKDPELVECTKNPTGTCVVTPSGQAVTGYYLEQCDTVTVVHPVVVLHEVVHAILCDVPGLDCDPGHESPVWQQCQSIKQCPDGRLLLEERVCDGTPDCAQGEDEANCP